MEFTPYVYGVTQSCRNPEKKFKFQKSKFFLLIFFNLDEKLVRTYEKPEGALFHKSRGGCLHLHPL